VYVALIVLVTVFSMAWYKNVMQRVTLVSLGISRVSSVFFSICTLAFQKMQVTPAVFDGVPVDDYRRNESIAEKGWYSSTSLKFFIKGCLEATGVEPSSLKYV